MSNVTYELLQPVGHVLRRENGAFSKRYFLYKGGIIESCTAASQGSRLALVSMVDIGDPLSPDFFTVDEANTIAAILEASKLSIATLFGMESRMYKWSRLQNIQTAEKLTQEQWEKLLTRWATMTATDLMEIKFT